MSEKKSTFPTTFSDIDTALLLKAFDDGEKRVRQSIDGLLMDEMRAHPKPGKWSVLQIVLHLTDSEIVGAMRTRQSFAQSDRRFGFYNQEIWTEVFDYQHASDSDLDAALQLFKWLRKTTSVIFHKASDGDWKKSGIHPEHGETTLRQVLELYADHSERHIEQILDLRKPLEKPINLPMILERRLY